MNRPIAGLLARRSPLNHLLTQTHLVRDLVGFDENRLGFRGGLVGEVLEVHLHNVNPL